MESSEELFVHLPNSTICYQTFGSPSHPAILLLAGGSESMLAWHPDFIALLSPPTNPHFVIRYDIRDSGRSTCYPISTDGTSQYTFLDLADDAIALLDHLHIAAAHLVGFSMGGGIAYTMAGLRTPSRVKSLTILSSTPVGPNPRPEDNLPPLNPELSKALASAPFPSDWHDKAQVVRFLHAFDALMTYFPPTEAELAEQEARAGRAVERAAQNGTTLQTMFNQTGIAMAPWPREALANVRCPTVVIHGQYDQNVPLPHGEALHADIKGSKLVVIDETRHELPRRNWDRLVQEIFAVMAEAQ